MKYLILTLALLLTVGCEKSTSERTDSYILPPDLKHCKIYKMANGKGYDLNVVHCPNSTTSTTHSCGKSCISNTTLIEE